MNKFRYFINKRILLVILINRFIIGNNSTDINIRLEEIPQSQERILEVEEVKDAVIISTYVGDVGLDEKFVRDFEVRFKRYIKFNCFIFAEYLRITSA